MIEVVACTKSHIEQIEKQDSQKEQHGENIDLRDEELALLSRAILVDGRPIAALGVGVIGDGVGHAWALLSDEAVSKYPVALSRIARRLLNHVFEIYPFTMLQAFTDPDYDQQTEWAEFLEFEDMGIHDNYRVMRRLN